MNIALINNGTKDSLKLIKLLGDARITTFDSSEAGQVQDNLFDLIVLSGSSRFPIEYNRDRLADEIKLIQQSATPILGICYGCELINVAFGGSLKDMGDGTQLRHEFTVRTVVDDDLFQGRDEFLAYDAHRWVIDTLPDELELLAESDHGPELIRHRTRPIYGFQFHPEKMLDETFGDELYHATVKHLL